MHTQPTSGPAARAGSPRLLARVIAATGALTVAGSLLFAPGAGASATHGNTSAAPVAGDPTETPGAATTVTDQVVRIGVTIDEITDGATSVTATSVAAPSVTTPSVAPATVGFRPAAAPRTRSFRAKADLNTRVTPSLSGKVLKVNAYRKGQPVPVVCQTRGGKAYGSTIWNKVPSGGYVVDAYLSTGTDGFVPGVPRCGTSTPPPGGDVRSFRTKVDLDGRSAKRLSAPRVKEYRQGTTVRIECQAYGPYAYGSPIWDRTTDNLWVPDHYVDTNTSGFVKGMARCDNDPKPSPSLPVNLDAQQIANAKIIIAVGKGYQIPRRGWVVALATAMQESTMRNLSGGDRDSVGLFQQRPSTGWGSVGECTTRTLAARAFYGKASHTSNPGLVDIDGWERMSITRAAQAVQRSAYPDAYAKWEPLARALVEKYAGSVTPLR